MQNLKTYRMHQFDAAHAAWEAAQDRLLDERIEASQRDDRPEDEADELRDVVLPDDGPIGWPRDFAGQRETDGG